MLRKIFSFFILLIGCNTVYSQCFQVADGNGVMSSNPYFVSCTPGGFTVFIQTDQTIGPYTIDWGDGTLNASGPSLVPPAIEQHTYAATTDTFNLVITNTADGCVVNGVVVLERNPLASIQLPAGDDNFGCTPIQFRFINSSTQISQTTTFTWDFGDGSPTETYDYTNQNTIVTHTYMPGVGVQSCNLEVRLTATNYCGSSTASFFPLRVWDLDEARITPSSDLLCYPDTVVQYTNNTIRNCFPEGNQSQRYEYWNFGDYWGLGHDSIINWRPWNPPIINPPPMAYPGVGIYSVMLIDSSFCGKDTSVINIEITNPPTAVLGASKDTICEGQSITFTNNSIGGANRYYWDYGQGAGFVQRNGSNKTVTFNQHGDYTIQLAVGVAGASSCVDTTSVDIYVNPSPVANFNFTPNNQCDSATVSFTNTSTGTIVYWKWTFGNGNDYLGENPPAQFYGSAGSYTVKLLTRNKQGCLDSISKTVRIREIPTADFSVSSVCLNQLAQFQDLSVSTTDPITTYKWYFGDGDSSSLQNPSHLYTSFGDYTVVQIVDNGYCQDTDTLNVKVENNPTAAFSVDKESGCSRLTVNFTNQSSVNATSFTWNFGDGSALVNARDTFHTFTNASNKDTSFIVQMIAATTFGCADTTYDTISVYPVPIPSFTSDAVANCGPVTVNFTNTTQGDSLSFRWNFGDGTAIVNDTNPTHVFQNKTLFISNYQVQLIVISNNGCRDTTTRTVTIYPEPIFTFQINPDSGCSPLRVNFPSVVGAVDYQWDFGDGNTGTGASPNHTYVNNTTNDLNLSVRLVARNSFGCRDTTYGNVLVYPSPTSDFSLDTNKGCQPLPIVVTNNSTGANHFFWTYGDGSSDTTANAIFTKTYSNTTSVTDFNSIELITTTDKGCRDTSTRVVQVHPFVKAAYLSDSVGCSPLKVSFINQSQGESSILWKFGDGAQTGSLNSNHTYNNTSNNNQNYLSKLIITSPQGCVDSAQRNILVYPKPIADYTLSDSIGCHPLPISISNNSINADSCIWKYGDGSNWNTCAASLQHTFTNTTSFFPLTYQSRLIVLTNHGCRDTLSKNIIVNPQVIADFNSDTAGCSPYPVSFQNQSIGGQNYNWTFGDGGNSFNTSPSHLFTNPVLRDTSFAVKLKVISQYNCTDSLTQNITVYPKPIASFALDTNRGCHPLPINITNASSIADSCRWTFGDGVISDTCFINKTKLYQNTQASVPVAYNTRLVVFTNHGCRDTANQIVTVNPKIQAGFSSDTAGCHPYRVNFQNQSTGVQTYNWKFGDGASSAAVNPNHVYNNLRLIDSTFEAKLVVNNAYGCKDSLAQNITVYPKPIASFALDTNRGCHPLPINITNASSIADSCRWTFGDGVISDTCFINKTKLYQNTQASVPVAYNTRLVVFTNHGCRDTANQIVTVNPRIQAGFSSDTAGCHPYRVNFQNQSTGVQTYNWKFGDGASSAAVNPNHVYNNLRHIDSTFEAKLVVNNAYGCKDSLAQNITVYPKPIASFALDTNRGCHPLPINITNASSIADSCRWTFGDGVINDTCFSNLVKTYTNTQSSQPVNYSTKLFVFTDRGCRDTTTKTIIVNPDIQAGFTSVDSGCHPLNVTFQNQSFGVQNYDWTFGDGGSSQAVQAKHVFFNLGLADSVYNTKLVVTSAFGCQDSMQKNITVFPKPIADYSVDVNNGCQPLPVVFSNASQGQDSCSWIFGDGNVNQNCGPIINHTYTNTLSLAPINYNSKLIVVTNKGCSDTLNRTITVKPQVISDFSADTVGCSPLDNTFRSQSFGAISYTWDFGDGATANGMITSHTFTNTGSIDSIYLVQLRARSIYGCDDVSFQNVLVRPTPIPDFTATPTFQLYPSATVNVTNITNNGNWNYLWSFGDSSTSTFQSPGAHLYNTWGKYNIQLLAYTAFCRDSISKPIEIDVPIPVPDFTDSASGCSPLEVSFMNNSLYGARYEWDFGDGRGFSTAENPTYTYLSEGVYHVTLRVKGFAPNKEAVLVKQDYIRVYKSPRAGFFINKEKVFIPSDPLVMFNSSVDADSYLWDFGDGNSSTEFSPTHYYQEEGAFQIILIAESINGCADTFSLGNLVLAELEGSLKVPNAFTPNPHGSNGGYVNPLTGLDGLNDVFYAKVAGVIKYELNIFNKWGELLFISHDIRIGWDGYYKGELCKQDAYVWKIKAEFADGKTVVKTGDLLLLR